MTASRSTVPPPRVLLHLPDRRRRLVDPEDVYYLEADGDDTLVRLRGARPLRDVRRLGELLEKLEPLGFVRVHRNHAVNPRHVRELRPARQREGWELRLEPPVNKLLPMSRTGHSALLAVLG
jgi:DNA-binding LytR/AlgR family response regulator